MYTLPKENVFAKSLHSCPTLCDPIDGSSPGSTAPGILQARTLEWVAISFSKAWKWKVKVKSLSHVRLFVTPWTAAHQAPPSMGFFRQEYWSGVPLPSPKENVDSTKLGIPTKKKGITKSERQATDWIDISSTCNWQSLLSGICKELLQINNSWTFKKKIWSKGSVPKTLVAYKQKKYI